MIQVGAKIRQELAHGPTEFMLQTAERSRIEQGHRISTVKNVRLYRRAAVAARSGLRRYGGKIPEAVEAEMTNMIQEMIRQGILHGMFIWRFRACYNHKR